MIDEVDKKILLEQKKRMVIDKKLKAVDEENLQLRKTLHYLLNLQFGNEDTRQQMKVN